MNICLCGSMAGYPHDATCPYPLYRGSEAQAETWEKMRARLANTPRCGDCGADKGAAACSCTRVPAGWSHV